MLFGRDKGISVISLVFAVGLCLGIILHLERVLYLIDIRCASCQDNVFIILFSLFMLSSLSSFVNDVFLTSLSLASLPIYGFIFAGVGIGWTHSPTFIERFIIIPVGFGIIIGLPVGAFGYTLGIIAHRLVNQDRWLAVKK